MFWPSRTEEQHDDVDIARTVDLADAQPSNLQIVLVDARIEAERWLSDVENDSLQIDSGSLSDPIYFPIHSSSGKVRTV